MHLHQEHLQEEFFPRMIIWQLGRDIHTHNGQTPPADQTLFTTQECLLTIDSIARLAKPIVVLTGEGVLQRKDLVHIVEYGFALGLKMIVEAFPHELTDEILEEFIRFGPKVFRVLLDGAIEEDMDTRFKRSPKFDELEETLKRLRRAGYEIHLGITVERPDLRQLAFEHDYALQRAARGLYCHLSFNPGNPQMAKEDGAFDRIIEEFVYRIAQMKRLSPKDMYFSPQCIKYGLQEVEDRSAAETAEHPPRTGHSEWKHWCLAGRSFAFISPEGRIQPCSSLSVDCGRLREKGYDFRSIWLESQTMQSIRVDPLACIRVRDMMNDSVHAEDVKKEE